MQNRTNTMKLNVPRYISSRATVIENVHMVRGEEGDKDLVLCCELVPLLRALRFLATRSWRGSAMFG